MKPENQHYIPQFLLRNFGHGQGRGHVWTCDKATGVIRPRSVRKSASGPDFYAINFPDERGRDTSLEDAFEILEHAAAPFLKVLAKLPPGRHEMGMAERELLSSWLALSHARVPGAIDTDLAMAKFIVAVQTDMLLRNSDEYRSRWRANGSTESDEALEARRLVDLREHEERVLVVEPAPETGLTGLGRAVSHIRPLLAQMRWDLLRRDRFPWFILGDQPVTIARPPDLSPFLGAGFATPGVEIYAPISPRALLVGTHQPNDGSITVVAIDPRERPPALMADWYWRPNLTAFSHAQREVFGRSQADLEAVRLALAPEDRTWVPQMSVTGIPKEWERYLPAGMVAESWGEELEWHSPYHPKEATSVPVANVAPDEGAEVALLDPVGRTGSHLDRHRPQVAGADPASDRLPAHPEGGADLARREKPVVAHARPIGARP